MSKCQLPNCGNMLIHETHPKYNPTIVRYSCPTCTQPDYVFYVCIECYRQQNSKTRRIVLFPKQPGADGQLKLDRQLTDHMNRYHPVRAKLNTTIPRTSVPVQQDMDTDTAPEKDNPPDSDMEYSLSHSDDDASQQVCIPAHSSEEIVSKSNFRLLLEVNGLDYHSAIKHMIFICCRKSVNVTPRDVHKYLPDEIAKLFVYTAIVAFQSDKSTLHTFSNITSMTYMKAFYPKGCTHLVIPNNLPSIKSIILSNNKLSWRTLLPTPKIEMLIDGGRHGICNLFELIAHATMMSTDRDYQAVRERHRALLKSKNFKDYLHRVLKSPVHKGQRNVIILCIFWSDGFEPHLSKQHRGTVWAMTITMMFYDCVEKDVYMVKTELYAVGYDKQRHDAVFRRLLEDLNKVSHPRNGEAIRSYAFQSHRHRNVKEKVNFFVLPFACLMDNPERRSNFWLLNHNAKNHVYFTLNCHLKLLNVQFETGDKCSCKKKIKDYIDAKDYKCRLDTKCDKCMAFDTDRLITHGTYSAPCFKVPDGTLLGDIPGNNLISGPGFLRSSLLIAGWTFAHERCSEGHWKEKEAQAYLSNVLCICDEGLQRFAEGLKQGCCLTNPLWEIFELDQALETVMHNCMNTGKAVRDLLFEWGASVKLKTSILNSLDSPLGLVQEVNLEDFKTRTVNSSDKFSGWVGENYKSFNICSPFHFKFLLDEQFQPKVPGTHPPDNKPTNSWSNDNFKHYLHSSRVRKVDVREIITNTRDPTKTNKREYQKTIGALSSKVLFEIAKQTCIMKEAGCDNQEHEAPFILVETKGTKKTWMRPFFSNKDVLLGKQFYELFPVVSTYFSTVMDTSLTGLEASNRADAHARLLMSQFLDILSYISDDPLKDFRLKACLFGLLRTSIHLRKVPWLKSIHEGDSMGEGIVKLLRAVMPKGFRSGWQRTLIRRYYHGHTMNFVKGYFPFSICGEGTDNEQEGESVSNGETAAEGRLPVVQSTISILTRDRKFRRYKKISVFNQKLQDNFCLSVLSYKESGDNGRIKLGFVSLVGTDWYVTFLPVDLTSACYQGLWYCKLGTGNNSEKKKISNKLTLNIPGFDFVQFCIALPGGTDGRYAFLAGDGKRMDNTGTFGT